MLVGVSEDPFILRIFDKGMATGLQLLVEETGAVPLAEEVGPCGPNEDHWGRGLTFCSFPNRGGKQAPRGCHLSSTNFREEKQPYMVGFTSGLTSRESRSIQK